MSLATAENPPAATGLPGWLVWAGALAVLVGLWIAAPHVAWLGDPADVFVLPLKGWISSAMDWLVNDLSFGLFTFKELTRGIAWVLGLPLQACIAVLSKGWHLPIGDGTILFPPVPWFAVVAAVTWLGWRFGGRGLAILSFLCFLYLAVFGQWASAMITLSSILVAVPVGVVVGTALGILAHRHEGFARVIRPILDLMQTVPVFAYLVPVLFLFGFGPVSAMIATIIYAMPPMVRVTMLALRGVAPEIVEFGNMTGCTARQMLWRILLPTARPSLMVGVNQVIMLSLNMVIIASMIGAGGLGRDVLTSLRRLAIGDGLEAGLAITLLAITLDRLSQAFVTRQKQPLHVEMDKSFLARHATAVVFFALVFAGFLTAALAPSIALYPQSMVIDTGPFWDELVRLINVHLYDYLDAIKSFLLIYVLVPLKRFMVDAPWLGVMAVLAVAGMRLGGLRLAVTVALMAAFIALTGNWEKAMISVYLCGLSVIIASAIGIPVGILSARHPGIRQVVRTTIDTLQTLPSFVYLIPVVMLFAVGDFSAMIAIVLYALAPAVRYADHGIRKVRPSIIEAGTMAGCKPSQLLWKVQLPLAMPELMLGLNQTIMMALSMLVITALVGTNDLGQEVYIALTRADIGQGVVAGLCVAFIAMIADRLISAWAEERKRQLQIE